MRIKKYFFLFIIFTSFFILLISCRQNVMPPATIAPTSMLIENSLIPTETSPLMTWPASTLTATPFPSITITLFYDSTITYTPQWSACPGIVFSRTDTRKGDILHVLRCEDGLEYDLGPLAKGVYAAGPNNKFLVYVTLSGFIYSARIGDRYLTRLFNLEQEHIFTVFNKKVTPDFKISFAGEGPIYRLVLIEKHYDQKRVYELPVRITQ